MHWGKLSNLISISPLNKPNLALRRPSAHAITIFSRTIIYPHFQILSLNNGNTGYAVLPKMHIGTSGWPSTVNFLHWGIAPLQRLWKRFEVENILVSCTQPGHLINTSIKQWLWSTTGWILHECLPFQFMSALELSDSLFIGMWVPSIAPIHCRNPCFSKKVYNFLKLL